MAHGGGRPPRPLQPPDDRQRQVRHGLRLPEPAGHHRRPPPAKVGSGRRTEELLQDHGTAGPRADDHSRGSRRRVRQRSVAERRSRPRPHRRVRDAGTTRQHGRRGTPSRRRPLPRQQRPRPGRPPREVLGQRHAVRVPPDLRRRRVASGLVRRRDRPHRVRPLLLDRRLPQHRPSQEPASCVPRRLPGLPPECRTWSRLRRTLPASRHRPERPSPRPNNVDRPVRRRARGAPGPPGPEVHPPGLATGRPRRARRGNGIGDHRRSGSQGRTDAPPGRHRRRQGLGHDDSQHRPTGHGHSGRRRPARARPHLRRRRTPRPNCPQEHPRCPRPRSTGPMPTTGSPQSTRSTTPSSSSKPSRS
mmetsp:Transcript_31024/g.99999  ORF Transcript_31024/g.99999 Transcript_31024/m.99999 type:complete len:360 (-) Transcript_31024:2039-3118(-)